MDLMIDTNILIEIENGNEEIIKAIDALKIDFKSELSITIFTFCEVYYGAMKKTERNRKNILLSLSEYNLINTSNITGMIYPQLLYDLEKRGKLIPLFDIFIASLAIEHDMILITADNDFAHITELKKMIIKI